MLSHGSSTNAAQLHRMLEILSITPGAAQNDHEQQRRNAELVAQLRDLSRETIPAGRSEGLSLGELSIDFAGYEVRLRGEKVHLTHREFALLSFLARHRGRVCTREELVAHLWGDRRLSSDRTVDIHIYRLRSKLSGMTGLIETIRNVGYVLRVEERKE